MTGGQLSRKLALLYGDDFHREVADVLDVDKSTVYRWINTKDKVPGAVAAWVDIMLAMRKLRAERAESDPK
jgi:hypothetical protein